MARKFKRYAPALALLSFTAEQGALSTNQLYQHALEMESSLRAGVQSSYAVANRPSSRRYSFIPYVGDGFVKYVDMNGGGEFKAIRMPNGYWALEATNEMFEMFGGRNKAASILDRLEDGDFFRDISRGSHIQRATRIAA